MRLDTPARAPMHGHAHETPPPPVAPRSRFAPALVVFAGVAALLAGAAAYVSARLPDRAPATAGVRAIEPTRAAITPVSPPAPAKPASAPAVPAAPVESAGHPLRSLLGIDVAVDVDGSRAHLEALFPAIASGQHADVLRYELPLRHPWFSEVKLSWKNEKDGKLVSVGFYPPRGADKLENQKEISDCLAKALGTPKVHEINHLAGEVNYFFGARFPKATVSVYRTYLWLVLQEPRGVAPVTFANVVRSLDACAKEP